MLEHLYGTWANRPESGPVMPPRGVHNSRFNVRIVMTTFKTAGGDAPGGTGRTRRCTPPGRAR